MIGKVKKPFELSIKNFSNYEEVRNRLILPSTVSRELSSISHPLMTDLDKLDVKELKSLLC